ncbi:hypothetical protein M3B90_09315 [Dermabacter sp. p3-SID358]|uniref:hypothetical protein n=1 Tax=Dermabacter sp. p3-SID358 TaxID=2916114 RepID=UPI0021A7B4E5|nr:hypothetical protein [Dermabacter sp. p3-SID358]MCT1867725.1 hypothetical protein [Dermabacter sp. p3-SID358]
MPGIFGKVGGKKLGLVHRAFSCAIPHDYLFSLARFVRKIQGAILSRLAVLFVDVGFIA